MPDPSLDACVAFDAHPHHASAVTATLPGAHHDTARALLAARGFDLLDDGTMVLVRIDHEEPYWAEQAAQALASQGITTEITPRLRNMMTPGWSREDIRMAARTLTEIRDVSDDAQQIYDDIRHGHLLIHAHAHDGHTTVAVGTYRDTGKSVHLHGEDHYREITNTFDSSAQALVAFEEVHGDTMIPGPAAMTDAESDNARALVSLQQPGTPPSTLEEGPVYAADPHDQDGLLNKFLTENRNWKRHPTWDDNTTVAAHESLTLRILLDRHAASRAARWTIAGYETPVSDHTWYLTAPRSTPLSMVQALLDHLAVSSARDSAAGSPLTLETIAAATQPLTDAGWQETKEARRTCWTSPSGHAGFRLESLGAYSPGSTAPAWWIWAGPDMYHPTWVIHIWDKAPSPMIAALARELAHSTNTREPHSGPTATAKQKSKPPPQPKPTTPRR